MLTADGEAGDTLLRIFSQNTMPLYRSGLFFHNLWDTCDPEAFTDEPIIERGTIVKIKPEWLNPGESGQMHYVVVKEYDENRILIHALGTGLPLAPTEAVEKSMVYLCGYVTLND